MAKTENDKPLVQTETEEKGSKKENLKAKLKYLLRSRKRKIIASILSLLVIMGVLYAVPITRYSVLGFVIKKDITFVVTDAITHKPVSEALVVLGNHSAKSASDGKVKFVGVSVGEYNVKTTKKYYKTTVSSYTVPVFGEANKADVSVTATGRQVAFSIVNKVTKVPLRKVTLRVEETSAVTDEKGFATIVLPANKQKMTGIIELEGYNKSEVEVVVTEQTNMNAFTLTPAGKVFYLSKQTGKINVMQASLDGGEPKVIVEGTGKEQDSSTSLLAARDWKYLALQARRDSSKKSQLHLVDAKTGELKLIDEGDVDIELIGWSDHRFIYKVSRKGSLWDQKLRVLKSYDAESGKLSIIDETLAGGDSNYNYQAEYIGGVYILKDKIVYTKYWDLGSMYYYQNTDKKLAIMSINPDGSSKHRMKEFAMNHAGYITPKLYEPEEVYFRVELDGGGGQYFEYEDGDIKSVAGNDDDFYNKYYPTYLISPTGKKTLWHEPRDGKNTILVGDASGDSSKQLANLSEYSTYGWYGDDYILLSKNNSELYIASVEKPLADIQPLKITDFHKPSQTYPGYGYGYGGI